MRIERDFCVFAAHTDWYTIVDGVGYVPTDKAPQEARDAMKRHNEALRRKHYK